VVFFLSCLFNLFFWPPTFYYIYKGVITPEMRKYKKHWKIMCIGFFNGLNGLLVVFSSSLERTPGPLQAILIQTSIPFTFLFSKFILGKHYRVQQIVGALIVLVGVFLSLVPLFEALGEGDASVEVGSEWYWPFIFMLSTIPAVLMNIFEEWVFHDMPQFNVVYMLAWQSLYQVLTVTALFWVDIIPGFGTSPDIQSWWSKFVDGLGCFFTPSMEGGSRCYFCGALGLGFSLMYCFSYLCSGFLMKYASANYNSIVQALAPPISVAIWFIFPGINTWGGGQPYTNSDLIFDMVSLPLLFGGMLLYRWFEPKKVVVESVTLPQTQDPKKYSTNSGTEDDHTFRF